MMIYRVTDAHDNAIIVVYLLYNRNRLIVLRTLEHHLFVTAVRFLCITYNDKNDCATREKLSVPLCVYSQLKFFCSPFIVIVRIIIQLSIMFSFNCFPSMKGAYVIHLCFRLPHLTFRNQEWISVDLSLCGLALAQSQMDLFIFTYTLRAKQTKGRQF